MINFPELIDRFNNWVWQSPLPGTPIWKVVTLRTLRIIHAVVRELNKGMLTLRAMSLVYTTMLSLVPLLAVSFSVLKGFGVHNQIEPMLLNLLEPLGEKSAFITERIIDFVDNTKAGVLGALGLAILIYTVISLLHKIEQSFNYTWHVSQHRAIMQRFSNYLSVVVIGPVLIFSALGATASVMSTTVMQQIAGIQPFGWLLETVSRILPFLLIIAAFTFIYIFIPNTKVKFKSALIGAIVSGVLWNSAGWAFASFVANSAKYTAIYSAFASLILFVFWIFLAWMILLIGSTIAFYHQHPEYQCPHRPYTRLSIHDRERLGLAILQLICKNYYGSQPPLTLNALALELGVPDRQLSPIIDILLEGGILTCDNHDLCRLIPATPPEQTTLYQVLSIIREYPKQQLLSYPAEGIDQLLAQRDESGAAPLQATTLKQLAAMNSTD